MSGFEENFDQIFRLSFQGRLTTREPSLSVVILGRVQIFQIFWVVGHGVRAMSGEGGGGGLSVPPSQIFHHRYFITDISSQTFHHRLIGGYAMSGGRGGGGGLSVPPS